MNAEQLLTHFDRIADAPDAIPRLRRFILDLAVRGKLVEQDPNDEPAEALLQRARTSKTRVMVERKIRSNIKPEPSVSAGEDVSPAHWVWTHLYDFALVLGGKRLPAGATFSAHVTKNIYIRVSDMKGQSISTDDLKHISDEVRAQIAKYTIERTDLYITIAGTIGNVGEVPEQFHGQNLTENAAKIVFREIDKRFLLLVLQSADVQSQFQEKIKQMAQPKLALKRISGIRIPLPPLAEQRRIVAKVDELMALCDRLETTRKEREATRDRLTAASLARLNAPDPDLAVFQNHAAFALNNLTPLTTRPDQIKALRRTILNLAVRGKLVPQDPEDEPASELLKRIAAEKARLVKAEKIRKRKTSEPAPPDSLAFELPGGWAVANFSDVLAELQTGPFGSSLHQNDYKMGGTPVINPASMRDGKIVPVEKMAVGADTLERLATFKLQAGDIVMGRRGEMGRCAVVTEQEDGWLCGTGSLILRPPQCLYPEYLAMLIGSPYVREYLGGFAVGATMQNLNQSILLKMRIGLPPLAEQHRVVAKVDELMALCDRLEASLDTGEDIHCRLLNVLLHEALGPGGNCPELVG